MRFKSLFVTMSITSLAACGSTEFKATGHETSGTTGGEATDGGTSTGTLADAGSTTGGTSTGGTTTGGVTTAGMTTTTGTTSTGTTTGGTSTGAGTSTGGTTGNPPANAVLLDDFASGTSNAANAAYWYTLEGGGNSDGQVSSDYQASGFANYGGKMTYLTDSGSYSYTQFVYQFANPVDLTAAPYAGIFYRIKGLGAPKVRVMLYTSLSVPSNAYGTYVAVLNTLPADWTSFTVPFQANRWTYTGNSTDSFTFLQAMQNCNGFKWEVRPNKNEGEQGSLILDDIYLTTP